MSDPVLRLASQNPHKLEELRRILPHRRIEPSAATDYPPEDGRSYRENARGKAAHGLSVAAADEWSLGEDSGIEVVALGGAPGIESARWADDGVARLLDELGSTENRRARYVCRMVALGPLGDLVEAAGVLEGHVAHEAAGSEGFGYDPVFVPSGEELTVAQLGDDWKQQHSHRARAALELDAQLPWPVAPPVVGSPAVDADAALRELAELSSQVASAAVLDEAGNVVASTGDGPLLAGVAAELLAAGAELHAGSPVTRVHVTLRDGGVSVVREGSRTAIATTAPGASPGLVLYDLRTLLHRITGDDAA